ncbi:sensor histidine kinase [Brachybacterium sp. GCM10030268]|uniref:sensor histidine kinase n=1 Tax=Brachybacterium sp. GCM10030268 TaxID=3273382 RepID=UPI0036191842
MRRLGTEGWAGLAMLVIAVAVSMPSLLGVIEPRIARPLWALLLVVFLAAVFGTGALIRRRGAAIASLCCALVSAWALILTVPATGVLHIVVVLTTALSVYVVPLPVTVAIAVVNTAAVLGASLLASSGRSEALMLAGFYLMIQIASALSTAALLREKRLRTELARAHVDARAASVMLAESTRTAERLRISRELHDLIGHQLTVLTLNLEAARHLDPERAGTHVEKADEVARALLRDVRSTVGELRAEPVDLAGALRGIVEGIPGLEVEVRVDPDVPLTEDQALAFLRLAQEAVTNTIRHSDAGRLVIELGRDGGDVVLEARDDGVGSGVPRLGNGLRGMRERFEVLGGALTIDGRGGFRVSGRLEAP